MKCPENDVREPKRLEGIARTLVAPFVDGRLVHADPPSPDFLVCRSDSVVGAVEVTSLVDENLMRLGDQLSRRTDQTYKMDALVHSVGQKLRSILVLAAGLG